MARTFPRHALSAAFQPPEGDAMRLACVLSHALIEGGEAGPLGVVEYLIPEGFAPPECGDPGRLVLSRGDEHAEAEGTVLASVEHSPYRGIACRLVAVGPEGERGRAEAAADRWLATMREKDHLRRLREDLEAERRHAERALADLTAARGA